MNSQQVHISTINGATINATMISDTISDATSEEDADFDDSDILNATVNDEVTAQLVSAGKCLLLNNTQCAYNNY